jgi:hypothetical protein
VCPQIGRKEGNAPWKGSRCPSHWRRFSGQAQPQPDTSSAGLLHRVFR